VHDALDEIRRRLQRDLPPADRKVIKGQRYVLLRARTKLSAKAKVSLQEVLELNNDLSKGYVLKEEFRDVFAALALDDARPRLKLWEQHVRESGVPGCAA
jgi:transposase